MVELFAALRRKVALLQETLALISERTGITVEELLELNPDIDPNSLTVGEKLKLTE